MKFKSTRYWVQKHDDRRLSLLFCLVNACRYFGLPGPKPGSRKWVQLVHLPDLQAQAKALKVKIEPIDPRDASDHVPVILPIRHWGFSEHHTLVIGGDGEHLILVNYRPDFYAQRSWKVYSRRAIELARGKNRQAWAVTPQKALRAA